MEKSKRKITMNFKHHTNQFKKAFLAISCFTFLLASCGGSSDSESSTTATTNVSPTVNSTVPTAMLAGDKLMAKSDCIGCHNKTQKVIGPAYTEIAAKYPLSDENVDLLASKIISGGKGVWGEVAMTPHASLSQDDAKEMVRYILSLKP
jgi:cytochrome c